MKNPFREINRLFALALVLTIIGCSNDDNIPAQSTTPNDEISIQDFTMALDENPVNGQSIGTVQAESEVTLSFSITTQTPAGALGISSSTGELTISEATLFDFEINPVITADISVANTTNSVTATVTVNLSNVNELSAQDFTVSIDENPVDGQIVGAIQATGSSASSFSIASQTPAGALSIDAGSGEISVVDPNLFDFEINPVITANIAIENAGDMATAVATINLNDIDEVTIQQVTLDIDENSSNGSIVGSIQANSNASVAYAISFQNPAGAFSIDANTGELSVADETLFDFETNPNMLATITVENGISTASANALVNLNDLNEIGEFKYGGVIFWIDPTSNHSSGLVCAVSDQSNSIGASWGSNTPTIGNVATAIGTGQANSDAILAVHTQGTNAAKLCNSYMANGYSDWYLPSKDELNEVYANKAIIQATSAANGGANFKNSAYWTSSEHDTDPTRALLQFFNYGYQNSNQKGAIMHVRAIRTFTDF